MPGGASGLARGGAAAGALRRGVATALLPDGYFSDAVFLASARDLGGAVFLAADSPPNREAAPRSLDALMAWLGWAEDDGGGDGGDGNNSSLVLSYAGDSSAPALSNGTMRLSFNLLFKREHAGEVDAATRAAVAGGGGGGRRRAQAPSAVARALSDAVASALAEDTGMPASSFSVVATRAQAVTLAFSRSRWRRLMDWILRNAWVVIGAAGGLAACVGAAAALRARARRVKTPTAEARARIARAREELANRTQKWRRVGWDPEKGGGGGESSVAVSTGAGTGAPDAPPAGETAASMPSDVAAGGAGDEGRRSPPLASPAPPLLGPPRGVRRALPPTRVAPAGGIRAAALPLAFAAPLAPTSLRAVRAKLPAAAAGEALEQAMEAREQVVRGAAGRSLAGRTRAAEAVRGRPPGANARAGGAEVEQA